MSAFVKRIDSIDWQGRAGLFGHVQWKLVSAQELYYHFCYWTRFLPEWIWIEKRIGW